MSLELGEVVNKIMKQSFSSIVDVTFTANLESLLDMVAVGSVNWKTVVSNFYPDLDEAVKKAEEELAQVKVEDEVTDVICDQCGRNMGRKIWTPWKIFSLSGIPGMPEYKTISGENRCTLSAMRKRNCH